MHNVRNCRAITLIGSSAILFGFSGTAKAADVQLCASATPVIGKNIIINKTGQIATLAREDARPTAQSLASVLAIRNAQAGATALNDNILRQSTTPGLTAPRDAPDLSEREIEFAADTIEYDNDSQIVTATGNVILDRGAQKLRAEKVVWNRLTGDIEALGNVQIVDQEGNRFYGDSIILTDSIRDGVIDNILLVLTEGGRLAANRGTRDAGVVTLEEATYSPCSVQNTDGKAKTPSWQIKAIRVVYSPADQRMRYQGARLELFGLPVIPMPGLNHPVGAARGSGLLVPSLRFSAANGAEYSQPYYFDLAPNRDLTVTTSVFASVLPMAAVTYRALTETGAYQITGYATASERIAVGTTGPVQSQNDFRGYIDASGQFQLGSEWTISGSLRRATDRTFLRRYDISRDDRLRSTFAAERITSNSYFSLAGWATQTLRVNDPQGQVPLALPLIDFRQRLTDPVLGGKVEFQLNSLAIGRTEGQDTQRAFGGARWDLRRLTSWGQQLTLTAYGRADIYNSQDNALTAATLNRGDSGFQARGVASFAADLQWPFVGEAFGGTQVFTPRVQIVASPSTRNLAIPNEDSRAIELEDSNLFALNRLPGYDRVEDGARIVYGIQWGLNRPGMAIKTVIGQSYRLNDKSDIIPIGTGLAQKTSDVVGRTEVRFRDFIQFTHRYRLDKDNLAVRRNEIDATIGTRETYATIGYLRLNRNIGSETEDLQDREELRIAGRFKFATYWSVFGSGVLDLSNADEDPTLLSDGFEPIRTRLGLAYQDDCLDLGLTWRRDFVTTGDAQRGNSFLLRIAFRNLGF